MTSAAHNWMTRQGERSAVPGDRGRYWTTCCRTLPNLNESTDAPPFGPTLRGLFWCRASTRIRFWLSDERSEGMNIAIKAAAGTKCHQFDLINIGGVTVLRRQHGSITRRCQQRVVKPDGEGQRKLRTAYQHIIAVTCRLHCSVVSVLSGHSSSVVITFISGFQRPWSSVSCASGLLLLTFMCALALLSRPRVVWRLQSGPSGMRAFNRSRHSRRWARLQERQDQTNGRIRCAQNRKGLRRA